jgi:hypothetical protein
MNHKAKEEERKVTDTTMTTKIGTRKADHVTHPPFFLMSGYWRIESKFLQVNITKAIEFHKSKWFHKNISNIGSTWNRHQINQTIFNCFPSKMITKKEKNFHRATRTLKVITS